METWNWHLLPESKRAMVIDLYNRQKFKEIGKLVRQYKVNTKCSSCDSARVIIDWTRWAIENNFRDPSK